MENLNKPANSSEIDGDAANDNSGSEADQRVHIEEEAKLHETQGDNSDPTQGENSEPRDKIEEQGSEGDSAVHLEEESHPTVDPAVVAALTEGFVTRFLPGLDRSQETVNQIRSSQLVLRETVLQEISKFRDCQAIREVEDTMTKARHYHTKLLRLQKEMSALHDKSTKLKSRALKLQQQKQTRELTRAHTREAEMERDRQLTAKIADPLSST